MKKIPYLFIVFCLFLQKVNAQYGYWEPNYRQFYKAITSTTAKTGTIAYTPSTNRHIAITSIQISAYGTTTGKLTLWFGDSTSVIGSIDTVDITDSTYYLDTNYVNVLDTVYTDDTDQPVMMVTFSPSSTSKPVLIFTPHTPVLCNTSNRKLKYTTDAGLSIDILLYGYEY